MAFGEGLQHPGEQLAGPRRSGFRIPRRLRLRAARSSRDRACCRRATSRALRKQASARSPRSRPRPPSSAAASRISPSSRWSSASHQRSPVALDPNAGFGQPISLAASMRPARRHNSARTARKYGSPMRATGAPPGVQTPFHQRDAVGFVGSCSLPQTLEAGGPGDPGERNRARR